MTKKSFSDTRKTSFDINSLRTKIKETGKKDYKDSRFWSLTRDKSDNGEAIIRFLPGSQSDETPFVRTYAHNFKGPQGQWLIENCPTTVGDQCPICQENSELYNSGNDENIKVARSRKRKLTYIANILVISDKANPDNNGKVFLYKFGAKIWDKVKEAANPQYEDETPINAFDTGVGGANFKLRVRKFEGYINYDKSTFDKLEALQLSKEELDAVLDAQNSLAEFTSKDNFKSFNELQNRFEKVTGQKGPSSPSTIERALVSEDDEDGDDAPVVTTRNTTVKPKAQPAAEAESLPEVSDDENDPDLAWAKKLIEGTD